MAQPSDVALRVVNARVTEPASVAQVLQPLFQQEINAGRFNLSVKLIAPQNPSVAQSDFSAALVQARGDPSGAFYPDPRLPSYMQFARRLESCAGHSHCYELNVEQDLRLYLRRDTAPPGECSYNMLAIAGRATVYLNLPPGAMMASQVTGTISVFGYLERNLAEKTTFVLPNGTSKSLAAALLEYGAEPTDDLNQDGSPESWRFQLEGAATGVEMPFVQADPNRDPCN